MEKFVEQTLLYDFYGELLNEHQRSIYADAVLNDLSLGEIAQEHHISRQGVHDMIKRVDKTLAGYEERLHLVEKFLDTKKKVLQIHELTNSYMEDKEISKLKQVQRIAQDILDNL